MQPKLMKPMLTAILAAFAIFGRRFFAFRIFGIRTFRALTMRGRGGNFFNFRRVLGAACLSAILGASVINGVGGNAAFASERLNVVFNHHDLAMWGWGGYQQVRRKLNQRDKHGWTRTHIAVKINDAGRVQTFVVRYRANPNIKNDKGETPMHIAAIHNRVKPARYLKRGGANLEIKDNRGRTPLHLAVEGGNASMMNFLIKEGANLEARDKEGKTPMHYVAYSGEAEVVRILHNAGAKIDARDKLGMTPLHHARNAHAVRHLIWKGADIHAKDGYNRPPLQTAIEMGHSHAVSQMMYEGADNKFVHRRDHHRRTRLHNAAEGNQPNVVAAWIAAGADKDAKDKWGMTPMHLAVQQNGIAALRVLIKNGANLYAASRVRHQKYPEDVANHIYGRHSEIAGIIRHEVWEEWQRRCRRAAPWWWCRMLPVQHP